MNFRLNFELHKARHFSSHNKQWIFRHAGPSKLSNFQSVSGHNIKPGEQVVKKAKNSANDIYFTCIGHVYNCHINLILFGS